MAIILHPKFPAPDRSNQKVNLTRDAHGAFDLGWCEGALTDGRPFRAETWVQDDITLVTIFFSVVDLEDCDSDRMTKLIEDEGLVTFKQDALARAECRRCKDPTGNPMWSVNIAIAAHDKHYVSSVVPYFRYSNGGEPPSLFNRTVPPNEGSTDRV